MKIVYIHKGAGGALYPLIWVGCLFSQSSCGSVPRGDAAAGGSGYMRPCEWGLCPYESRKLLL